MRLFFKYLLIISLVINFSNYCFSAIDAQKGKNYIKDSTEVNDSLKAQISKLEKLIEDGSYTRIPNKDFENVLDNKIQKALRETVNWWLIIIAALISILGFLVNKYANTYLQTIVEKKVGQLKKENEEKIKSISNHYFSSVIDSLLDFKIESIEKKNHNVDESVVDDLKSYLKDESVTITESKKVYIIDIIMRCYYSSNIEDRIKKMITLIKGYEEKFTLLASTYANAAIAFSDQYDRYGAKDDLNTAIENCNKSIRILPDYGVAFAQKLELYIMAISKAYDEAERKQFENELFKVFKDIENNTSTKLCTGLIERFDTDKKYFVGPYLEKLYNDYPEEMKKITERVNPASPETITTSDQINT